LRQRIVVIHKFLNILWKKLPIRSTGYSPTCPRSSTDRKYCILSKSSVYNVYNVQRQISYIITFESKESSGKGAVAMSNSSFPDRLRPQRPSNMIGVEFLFCFLKFSSISFFFFVRFAKIMRPTNINSLKYYITITRRKLSMIP